MSDDATRRRFLASTGVIGSALVAGCGGSTSPGSNEMTEEMVDEETSESTTDGGTPEGMADDETQVTDPEMAPRAAVDRFSEEAGTLMVRTADNDLPGPDEPIDFDQMPFRTRGLGPDGGDVTYYNFDVQPREPAPIYVLFREDEDSPVEGQLNIVDVIPGDDGYNDFWQVHEVTVPADYTANTATSVQDLMDTGYEIAATDVIKNCPIVPDGSTASMRSGDCNTDLVEGWYDGEVVSYFLFEEAPLMATDGSVPVSPIYVTFNRNPGEDGGGPSSGFVTEADSDRTHNVVATLPGDDGYSPLWLVNFYDNADFDSVSDLDSARDANLLESGAATVNCPIVAADHDN